MTEAERLAGLLTREGHCSGVWFCVHLLEAATLIREQAAELERLREGLRAIEEGRIERPIGKVYRNDGKLSKHDRCVHDVWMYEACENCIDAHVSKALGGS